MFDTIEDPLTNKKFNITSRKGKQILNNYIKHINQNGGFIFSELISTEEVDTEHPGDEQICLVNDVVNPDKDGHGWITADSLRRYLKSKAMYNLLVEDEDGNTFYVWETMIDKFRHWAGGDISDDIWPPHLLALKNMDDYVELDCGDERNGPINRFHNFIRAEVKPDGGYRIIKVIEEDEASQSSNPEAERIINNNIELIINRGIEKANRHFREHGHNHPGRAAAEKPTDTAITFRIDEEDIQGVQQSEEEQYEREEMRLARRLSMAQYRADRAARSRANRERHERMRQRRQRILQRRSRQDQDL